MKLGTFLQTFLIAVTSLMLSNSGWAVTLDQLYSVVIQVSDNSLETRNKVLPQAFEQVIRRVASSHNAINNPVYNEAKKNIDNYISTYFYSGDSGAYTLTLQFNEKQLNDLITKMGRSQLSKNRPQVLLWLVMEENNQPNFVTSSSHEAIANTIDDLSSNYGMPVLLPLLDLTERLFITEADVINFNLAPLQEASGRYNSETILIGKINHLNNQWHCEWRLLPGAVAWNSSGEDLDVELELMFNQLGDQLIARYKQNVDNAKQGVALRIKNVNSVADYAKVVAYLKQITAISQVEIGSVDGNQAMFVVSAEGGKDAVIKALQIDNLLVSESEADTTLTYRIN